MEYSPLGALTESHLDASHSEYFTVDALGNRVDGTVFNGESTVPYDYLYEPGTGRLQESPHDLPGTLDDTTYYDFTADGDLTRQQRIHRWLTNCDIFDCSSGTIPDTSYESRITNSAYDGRGRLERSMYVQDSVPAPTMTYKQYISEESYRYDALDRRVWTRVVRGENYYWKDPGSGCQSTVTRSVWDGSQILLEYRSPGDSGNPDIESDDYGGAHHGRVRYIHAFGVDEPVAVIKGGSYVLPYTNWRGMFDMGTCPTDVRSNTGSGFPGEWHGRLRGAGRGFVGPAVLVWQPDRARSGRIGIPVQEEPVLRSGDGSVHPGRPDRARGGAEPVRLRRWRSGQLLGSVQAVSLVCSRPF